MSQFEQGITVEIDGVVYDFAEGTTRSVTLRRRETGDELTMSLRDAAHLVHREGASVRVFDTHEGAFHETLFLADDIEEVLTGVRFNGESRPKYDPALTSLTDRIQRKVDERHWCGRHVTERTFYRKIDAYRRLGIAGLIDGRTLRVQRAFDHADDRVYRVLMNVVDSLTERSTGTVKRVIVETNLRVFQQYGPIPLPSRATYYRWLRFLGLTDIIRGTAQQRRTRANQKGSTRKNVALSPGSEVQIDSTTLDVEITTPSGERCRPILTIMIDVFSRSILSYTFRLDGAKAVDHVFLLAQALTPRVSRPERGSHRALVQQSNHSFGLLSPSEHAAHAAAHPFIYPRRIVIDNGRDFLATTFRVACGKFGIDLSYSPPFTPTTKPHVERQWGSFNTLFLEHLRGHVGRSVPHRGKKQQTKDLLTLELLTELFEDWVISVWQNRPHSGLVDPLKPKRLLTPNEKAASATIQASEMQVPLTEADYIDMLDTHWREIQQIGVHVNNRVYDSDELNPLRGTKSRIANQKNKWPVKVDPYNFRVVWVDAGEGQFIECWERGSEVEDLLPTFAHEDLDDRTMVARTAAVLAGTPFPEPRALPSVESAGYFSDEPFVSSLSVDDLDELGLA